MTRYNVGPLHDVARGADVTLAVSVAGDAAHLGIVSRDDPDAPPSGVSPRPTKRR